MKSAFAYLASTPNATAATAQKTSKKGFDTKSKPKTAFRRGESCKGIAKPLQGLCKTLDGITFRVSPSKSTKPRNEIPTE